MDEKDLAKEILENPEIHKTFVKSQIRKLLEVFGLFSFMDEDEYKKRMNDMKKMFNEAGDILGYKLGIKDDVFRITDIDQKTKNPIPGRKPIDKNSLEYFKYWESTVFIVSRLRFKEKFIDSPAGKKYYSFEEISKKVDAKTLRISDIEKLIADSKINEATFDKLLDIIVENLENQISDNKYKYTNEVQITEKNINEYLNKDYIDKEFAAKYITLIRLRDLHTERKKQVSNSTSSTIKSLSFNSTKNPDSSLI